MREEYAKAVTVRLQQGWGQGRLPEPSRPVHSNSSRRLCSLPCQAEVAVQSGILLSSGLLLWQLAILSFTH